MPIDSILEDLKKKLIHANSATQARIEELEGIEADLRASLQRQVSLMEAITTALNKNHELSAAKKKAVEQRQNDVAQQLELELNQVGCAVHFGQQNLEKEKTAHKNLEAKLHELKDKLDNALAEERKAFKAYEHRLEELSHQHQQEKSWKDYLKPLLTTQKKLEDNVRHSIDDHL